MSPRRLALAPVVLLLDTPAPPPTGTLSLGGAIRSPMAGAPRIRLASDELPAGSWPATGAPGLGVYPLTVINYELPDDTPMVEVPDFISANWLDQLGDKGTAALEVWNDDPVLASIERSNYLRFRLYGEVAFGLVYESKVATEVDPGEEPRETTTISGCGPNGLLEWAVTYPSRGVHLDPFTGLLLGTLPIQRDRVFNWTAPSGTFDDSGWGFATAIGPQSGSFAYWTGLPDASWEDRGAQWIWAKKQDPSYPALDQWSPAGPCYFRKDFTVPLGVHRLSIYLTMDAAGTLYFDGDPILSTDNGAADPTEIRQAYVDVTPGQTYTLAAICTNDPDPEGDMIQNPAGVLMTAYAADNQGNTTGSWIVHTDATWKIVEYPPFPPGMTPGQALLVLLGEAHARGCIPFITPTFTGLADSAGQPFPEVGDLATKVGNDLLMFTRELAGPYIDWRVNPGDITWDVYVKGGLGMASGVTLAPAPSNNPDLGDLTALRRTTV